MRKFAPIGYEKDFIKRVCEDNKLEEMRNNLPLPYEIANMILYKNGGFQHPVAKIFKERIAFIKQIPHDKMSNYNIYNRANYHNFNELPLIPSEFNIEWDEHAQHWRKKIYVWVFMIKNNWYPTENKKIRLYPYEYKNITDENKLHNLWHIRSREEEESPWNLIKMRAIVGNQQNRSLTGYFGEAWDFKKFKKIINCITDRDYLKHYHHQDIYKLKNSMIKYSFMKFLTKKKIYLKTN